MKINIGTYNICHGEGLDGIIDINRQGQLLKENNLDIMFLQEIDLYTDRANFNEIEELSKVIGIKNYYYGKNRDFLNGDYRGFVNGEYGNGIISKYEIIESNNYLVTVEKSHETKGICYCKIKANDKIINLFSVHLSVFKKERINYIKKLVELIKNIKDEPIIVGGDFNIGIKKIGDHKYIYKEEKEFEEYRLLKEYLTKLNNKDISWISETGQACIDTFFYSKEFKLIDFKTVNNTYSDHALIVVSLDME